MPDPKDHDCPRCDHQRRPEPGHGGASKTGQGFGVLAALAGLEGYARMRCPPDLDPRDVVQDVVAGLSDPEATLNCAQCLPRLLTALRNRIFSHLRTAARTLRVNEAESEVQLQVRSAAEEAGTADDRDASELAEALGTARELAGEVEAVAKRARHYYQGSWAEQHGDLAGAMKRASAANLCLDHVKSHMVPKRRSARLADVRAFFGRLLCRGFGMTWYGAGLLLDPELDPHLSSLRLRVAWHRLRKDPGALSRDVSNLDELVQDVLVRLIRTDAFRRDLVSLLRHRLEGLA